MSKFRTFRKSEGTDRLLLNIDVDADLAPAFNWNVKQLFAFVVAEYETKTNPVNQASAPSVCFIVGLLEVSKYKKVFGTCWCVPTITAVDRFMSWRTATNISPRLSCVCSTYFAEVRIHL